MKLTMTNSNVVTSASSQRVVYMPIKAL